MKRMKEMRTWKRTAGCFLAAVMTAGLLMGGSTQGGGAAQAETNQEAAGDDTKAAAGEAVTEAVKAAKAPWDGAGLNMGALEDGSQWMVYLPPLPEKFAAGPW